MYLRNNLAGKLYKILIINLLICLISIQYLNETIISLTYYCFILLNIIIFGLSLKYRSFFSQHIEIIIILIVFLILQVVITGYVGIVEISSIFGFLSLFLIGYYSSKINLDYGLMKVFRYFLLIASVNNFMIFFTPQAYRNAKNIDFVFDRSLTLGFANPNTTASVLLVLIILNFLLLNLEKKIFFKILLTVTLLMNYYFLFLTDSRSSFFAATIFSLVYFFNIKPTFNFLRILFVILFGFVFVFLYSFLFISGIGTEWQIFGKPFFSGREEYLVELFYDGLNYPFFGNPEKYGYNNHLNGVLSVFLSGGLVMLSIFVIYFTKYINRLFLLSSQYNYAALAILIVFLQTISEGNFIITGTYFSALFSILFVFANTHIQIQNNFKVSV